MCLFVDIVSAVLQLNVCYLKRFVCAYMMLQYGLNTQLENSISFAHVIINA
jgi:hypothetical protein